MPTSTAVIDVPTVNKHAASGAFQLVTDVEDILLVLSNTCAAVAFMSDCQLLCHDTCASEGCEHSRAFLLLCSNAFFSNDGPLQECRSGSRSLVRSDLSLTF